MPRKITRKRKGKSRKTLRRQNKQTGGENSSDLSPVDMSSDLIKVMKSLPSRKIKALDGVSMTYSNRVLIQLKKKFYSAKKIKNDMWFNTKCNSNGVKSPKTYYGSLKMGGSNVSLFGISGQSGTFPLSISIV